VSKFPGVFKLSNGELAVWEDGGIHIKAVTSRGDPVELSETEALELADALIRLAKGQPLK
jgi:glycogen debranching enzyme